MYRYRQQPADGEHHHLHPRQRPGSEGATEHHMFPTRTGTAEVLILPITETFPIEFLNLFILVKSLLSTRAV